MITEDYVSFEIAKLLKEKGFDEPCKARYDNNGTLHYEKYPIEASRAEMYNSILCPTRQMTIKWLREVHNIFIVNNYINEKNSSYIISLWQGDNCYKNITSKDYPIYEEAVEAAIKYCLENLI